jgi:hypothetical protein
MKQDDRGNLADVQPSRALTSKLSFPNLFSYGISPIHSPPKCYQQNACIP